MTTEKILLVSLLGSLALTACNSSGGGALGQDQQVHSSNPVPGDGKSDTPITGGSSSVVGDSCAGKNDSAHPCMGLKYVVYKNTDGTPVMTQDDVISTVRAVNKVWSACNISFQVDQYLAANPVDYGLTFNTANDSELDSIRKAFQADGELLVATTGTWDRSGTLGNTGANAWTNMPGDGIYGVILESPVGTFGNIVAHELGHYLNLDHVSDQTDVMNPIVYDNSNQLTADQCSTAMAAINYYWQPMRR